MLKRKLALKRAALDAESENAFKKAHAAAQLNIIESSIIFSAHFATPFWKRFYDLELALNAEIQKMQAPAVITHTYNPVEYAAELHCDYLQKFLNGRKKLMFVGMNPGANGMGQTGVPFGNINTVQEIMCLSGKVTQPPKLHPKRRISGLLCTIEEPSGVRIWQLLKRLAGGSLHVFAQQCFVHNFCPLAFYDKDGKNITPSELKGDYKSFIRDVCMETLDKQIALVQPEILVAVGDYVYTSMKKSIFFEKIQILKLHHPSPRALNNQNWPEKAEKWLQQNDLVKYIRNEI